MRNSWRLDRPFLVGAAVAALVSLHSGNAGAQTVYCANCSDFIQQGLQYAKEAENVRVQAMQYTTQLQQYANMVRNTAALPVQVWNQVQSTISQVQALSNVSMMLGGQGATVISRLNGATAYASRVGSLGNITSQYNGWAVSSAAQMQQTVDALHFNEGQMRQDSSLLTTLQQHAQSADGQMQALQAANELASFTATQSMQTQSLIATGIQMNTAQLALEQDRRNAERLRTNDFLAAPALPTAGYGRF